MPTLVSSWLQAGDHPLDAARGVEYLCAMSLAQEVGTSTIWSGSAPAYVGPLLFAIPTFVHLCRALGVHARTAEKWLTRRGFEPTPANTAEVRRFLRRFRWTRTAASAAFYVAAVLLITQLGVPFGIVTGPYLLALLAVEATAPTPQRARTRSASLVARGRSYFAPYRSLWLARALIAAAAVTAVAASSGYAVRLAGVHALVMLTGLLALEAALTVGARRALPEATEARALDTAIRVQAARTTVAAATVFGGVGFVYSTALISSGDPLAVTRFALTTTAQLLLYVAIGVAISLAEPLSQWQPRQST